MKHDCVTPLIPELEASGLPWRADMGARHIKIFICNRLVASVPRKPRYRNQTSNRAFLNVRSQIRRAVKDAK